ncbi:hypothetical protein HaLaN_10387, partial [Haematococcus lacustris]
GPQLRSLASDAGLESYLELHGCQPGIGRVSNMEETATAMLMPWSPPSFRAPEPAHRLTATGSTYIKSAGSGGWWFNGRGDLVTHHVGWWVSQHHPCIHTMGTRPVNLSTAPRLRGRTRMHDGCLKSNSLVTKHNVSVLLAAWPLA